MPTPPFVSGRNDRAQTKKSFHLHVCRVERHRTLYLMCIGEVLVVLKLQGTLIIIIIIIELH